MSFCTYRALQAYRFSNLPRFGSHDSYRKSREKIACMD
jgi:hypothetical protein